MPVRARAELLRALRLRPADLEEEISRWESDPRTQGWAELLGELRDEPVARLTVREMLERSWAPEQPLALRHRQTPRGVP
jgi:hypothetical protein